ncbi:hypothetical protein FisN_40Lh005 [Fistulifera solaris]|uniref:Uncharacterized protein n=1 Tax=Fistulifera solaris TaxID=1519565 RepID=A0A1Z5J9Q4_FISSO|nr:hypothetical protein FisN_40Lh005 [Fistulifera solaris]|eukprot:GAX10538.1 hypothetical protein FisN_40Lh005 [Fistulifera solaris]
MDASLRSAQTEDKQSKRTLPTASHTSYQRTSLPQPDDEETTKKEEENEDEIISVNSSLATNDAFEENCIQILGTPHESVTRRMSSTRWNRLQKDPVVYDRLYQHAVYKMELERMPWNEERQKEDERQAATAGGQGTRRPSSDDWKTIVALEASVSHRIEHAKSALTPMIRTATSTPSSFYQRKPNTKVLQATPRRRSPNTRYQQYSAAIRIQTWWRAYSRRSNTRKDVCHDKLIPIKTGAHYLSDPRTPEASSFSSGSTTSVQQQQNAIHTIQSWWRMTILERDYRTLLWAVLTIQRFVRQSEWHRAARTIQTHYRGYKVRQSFGWLRVSVIVIQSVIRMFLIRRKIADYYHLLQQRRLLLQYKRVMVQRDLLVQKRAVLRSRRTASILIQTQWRRYQAMGMLESLRACSIMLQAQMRGYLVRKSWQHTLQMNQERLRIQYAGAVCIQTSWRRVMAIERYTLWKQVLLQNQRPAIVLIQTQWRRYLAVRMYQLVVRMHQQSQERAAVIIQTKCRAYLALKRYDMIQHLHVHNRERSASVIQSQWRRYLASRVYCMVQSLKRQCQEKAAVKVQACWRRYAGIRLMDVLKQMVKEHQDLAATFLQAQWRRRAAAKVMSLLKLERQQLSAVMIQSRWRRYQAIEMFECLRACITIIQSQIRGYLVRHSIPRIILTTPAFRHYQGALAAGFDCFKAASIDIQRVVRGYLMRQKIKKYRIWLSAAVIIQSHWRSFHAVQTFQLWRLSAISIQSCVRMYMIQRWLATAPPGFLQFQSLLVAGFHRSNTACTQIQRVVRGYLVRHNFDLLQAGALQRILCRHDIIMSFPETYRWQIYWRTLCVQNQFNLNEIERHALRLQCWWRMIPIQHHLHNLQILSVWLQAIIRGFLSRNNFKRAKSAATTIQATYRGWQSARDFSLLWWAAITVQTWWRRYHAALLIQSMFRMWMCSPQRQLRHESAILLQKSCRQMLAQNSFISSRVAALLIQSIYRGFKPRYQLAISKNAATNIQARVRTWLAVHRYNLVKTSLLVLQSVVRKFIIQSRNRSALYQIKINKAAVRIQTLLRRVSIRQRYITMRESLIVLQSHVRAWLIRSYFICIKYELNQTVILIQACARRWLVRQRCKLFRTAIILLQSWARGVVTSRKLQKHRRDAQQERATKMQAVARKCLAVREASMRRTAVLHIQSHTRALLARQCVKKAKLSSIKLQSHLRGWIERNKFNNNLAEIEIRKMAASVIQRQWRAYYRTTKCPLTISERSPVRLPHTRVISFLEYTVAAIRIQSSFRGYQCCAYYKPFRKAIVLFQRKFRLSSQYRTTSALTLQRYIRGILCRRIILSLRKTEENRLLRYVLQIQTLLRNFFDRNRFLDDTTVTFGLQKAHRHFEERRQNLPCDMLSSTVSKQYKDWKFDAMIFILESVVTLLRLRVEERMLNIPALVLIGLVRQSMGLKLALLCSGQHFSSAAQSSRLTRAFRSVESACCVMIQRLYRGYQARCEYKVIRIGSKKERKRHVSRSAGWNVRIVEQLSGQRIRVEILVDDRLVQRHKAAFLIQKTFLNWRERRRQICYAVLQSLWKVKNYQNVDKESPFHEFQADSTPYLCDERVREAHMDFQLPLERSNTFSDMRNQHRVQLMDTVLVPLPFLTPLN